ncbi:unnamed protein product [Peniophora sp. CBMAI 1063]|nr:unnamed protein product [Peniophora sp. CBMAI 1063]
MLQYKSQKKTKKTKAPAKGAEKAAKALLSQKEVAARWAEEVKRTKWVYDEWFKHPPHTETIARGAAKDLATPKLKPSELDTLPYEEKFANNGALMKLHDLEHVDNFIEKRKRWLDRTVHTSRLRPQSAATDGAQAQAGPSSSATQESTSSAPQDDGQPPN